MQKKILLYITFFLTLFSPLLTKAFLDGDLGIDIYNTIDEGIDEYEEKMYEYEFTEQGEKTITEKINNILVIKGYSPCIKNLDIDSIEEIKNGDINTLKSSIDEKCLNKDKNISYDTLKSYMYLVKEISDNIKEESQEKTKKTYEISRIGLYSDGDTNNSPFDLINDIKEIEKIIFIQESEYNGEENSDLDESFSDMLHGLFGGNEENDDENLGGNENDANSSNNSSILPSSPLNNNSYPLYISPGTYNSNYVCSEDTNTLMLASGLSEKDIATLLKENSKNALGKGTSSGNIEQGNDSPLFYKLNTYGEDTYTDTGYEEVNDNSIWPCDGFFCIEIEFVTHNQEILGAGKDTSSIEGLVTKSNEHLKKFANTSLVQSKMTTNNFELGLMDLDLPSIFHMGVQIQKRSPPILNIDNQEKEQENNENEENNDKGEYSFLSMLEEYYKNNGLDFNTPNSIQQFLGTEKEMKSIKNSAELSYPEVAKKALNLKESESTWTLNEEKNNFVSKSIDKVALGEDNNIMFQEFIELERFSGSFNDYISALAAIVEQMNKIPIHKS
ncbi:hypothetical protein HGA92_03085 [Candidatus Gracilibacteria bacterium]|nr:hypothetical protein [Candidatus Gracilibacteria bacterium]NUJ99089.1 hypothetical protein [Candidatus Gracilibacteria bacterium]